MKKDHNKIYQVMIPVELMLDAAQIILQASIQNSVEDIKRSKGSIVFELTIEEHQLEAFKNLEEILSEFNQYRYSEEP